MTASEKLKWRKTVGKDQKGTCCDGKRENARVDKWRKEEMARVQQNKSRYTVACKDLYRAVTRHDDDNVDNDAYDHNY